MSMLQKDSLLYRPTVKAEPPVARDHLDALKYGCPILFRWAYGEPDHMIDAPVLLFFTRQAGGLSIGGLVISNGCESSLGGSALPIGADNRACLCSLTWIDIPAPRFETFCSRLHRRMYDRL
jgi:hypothetical protein